MEFQVEIEVQAPIEAVCKLVLDVERWHEWTSTITSVRRLDPGPFAVGSKARVEQPKLMPATWEVTKLEKARGFTWVSSSPGVRVTAGHWMEERPGGTHVTLSIVFAGLLGPFFARITRSLTESYMRMEAEGLKKRSEKIERSAAGKPS